jgi:hypothetical protein
VYNSINQGVVNITRHGGSRVADRVVQGGMIDPIFKGGIKAGNSEIA